MPDISSSLSKREVNARQNTYTKSEIDLKDGAIQAIAEAAQTTADTAEKKNQEQDQLIAELQKSSHSHSNQDVLDKTEQPYTTAERDKLAGLENYTHPTYAAHAKGFYKFASDGDGHVTNAENVTKEDITALGIPSENTRYKFTVDGTGLEINQSTSADFYRLKFPSTRSITSLIPYFTNTYDNERGYCWCQLAFTVVESTAHDYKKIGIEGGYEQGERIYYKPQGVAKIAIALYGVAGRRGISITADLPLHNAKLFEVRPLENLKIFSSAPEKKLSVYAVGRYNSIDTSAGGKTNYDLYLFLYADESYTATAPGVRVTVETSVYPFDGHCSDVNRNYSNVVQLDSSVISESIRMSAAKVEAVTDILANKADKSEIPDISGKQDKSTAVTHTANTAVGSATKPVYIAANGAATPISHSINSDVPANAKFTDTTYSDATQSAHGLMTAADKKKLDDIDLSKYLPLHGTADQSKALSNGSMRYGWCVNNAANANSGYRWFRIGTMTASKNGYDTETLYMHICNGNNIYGVIGVYTRTDSTGTGIENMRVSWLVRDSSPHHAQFKLVGIASSTGVKFELWCYTSARWYQTAYYVIADLVLTGGLSNRWVLETHGDGDAKNATTVGTTSVTDVDLSYAAKAKEADTLTDSGWVDVSNFKADISSFSQITTSFRKYGDIVFIRGRVQPKSNMTSISLCSTTSTSLTGITPSHSVKGVGVSTDGLTPFMVNITTSPANSVILKGSFSANKIYDFEFSYIK